MRFQFQITLDDIAGIFRRRSAHFLSTAFYYLNNRGFETCRKWLFGFEVELLLRGVIMDGNLMLAAIKLLHYLPLFGNYYYCPWRVWGFGGYRFGGPPGANCSCCIRSREVFNNFLDFFSSIQIQSPFAF